MRTSEALFVLGLRGQSLGKLDEAVIQKAYRAMSIRSHPDKPGGSGEAMSRVTAARDDLIRSLKKHKRKTSSRQSHRGDCGDCNESDGRPRGVSASLSDLFRSTASLAVGATALAECKFSIRDAYSGKRMRVPVTASVRCPVCALACAGFESRCGDDVCSGCRGTGRLSCPTDKKIRLFAQATVETESCDDTVEVNVLLPGMTGMMRMPLVVRTSIERSSIDNRFIILGPSSLLTIRKQGEDLSQTIGPDGSVMDLTTDHAGSMYSIPRQGFWEDTETRGPLLVYVDNTDRPFNEIATDLLRGQNSQRSSA